VRHIVAGFLFSSTIRWLNRSTSRMDSGRGHFFPRQLHPEGRNPDQAQCSNGQNTGVRAPKPGALPGRAMPRLYRFTDSKSLPRTAPSGACLRTVFGFSTPSHRLKGEGHFCSGGQKLRMRKSLVLASTFSRIAGSGSMRAISIAPIIVEKIAKKARSLSEVRPARHERQHLVFVVHELRKDLWLHPLVYPRQFGRKCRQGASGLGMFAVFRCSSRPSQSPSTPPRVTPVRRHGLRYPRFPGSPR